ncbi:MAG: hypothetical protein AB4352_04785 [Hormoscilla sp.]
MGPLKNLLGGKKAKSGKDTKFSVKFDDAAQGKPAESAAPAPAPAPVAAAAPAPAETTPATPPAPVSKAEAKKAKAEAAKKAKAEALQAKKAKQEAIKAEKAAAKKGKAQPTAAASTAAKAPEPEIVNFAPTYLNPANSLNVGRRRPGPSMNSFMTMARQVKVPKVTPKAPKAKK